MEIWRESFPLQMSGSVGLGVWLRVFPPPPGRTVLPGSMGRTAPFVRDPAIVLLLVLIVHPSQYPTSISSSAAELMVGTTHYARISLCKEIGLRSVRRSHNSVVLSTSGHAPLSPPDTGTHIP